MESMEADTSLQGETDTTYTALDDRIDALNTTFDSDIGLLTSSVAGGKCFHYM